MLHPHDEALLYDLLDGRMAPGAAEEVRRRIEDEPELRAGWERLDRLRAALRALPTPAVPPDFAATVRVRAGLPALPVESASPESLCAPAVGSGTGAGSGGGGAFEVGSDGTAPILRFRRAIFAVAATLGLALGAGVFWVVSRSRFDASPVHETAGALRANEKLRKAGPEAASTPYGQRRDAKDDGADLSKRAGPAVPMGPPSAFGPPPGPAATAGAAASGTPRSGAPGRYRVPGGGVPAGLRDPAATPLTAPGPKPGAPPVPKEASSPPPTAPAIPPREAEDADSGTAEGLGNAPEPVRPTPSSGRTGGSAGGLPDTGGLADTTLTWASEGVDDVFVLEAPSLDAARAEVALLGTVSDAAGLVRLRLRRLGPDGLAPFAELGLALSCVDGEVTVGGKGVEPKEAEGAAAKPRGAPMPSPPKAQSPPKAKQASAPERGPVAIGSLRLDLDDAAWRRLEAALPPLNPVRPALADATRKRAKDDESPSKDEARGMGEPPDNEPTDKRSAPSAKPAGAAGAGGAGGGGAVGGGAVGGGAGGGVVGGDAPAPAMGDPAGAAKGPAAAPEGGEVKAGPATVAAPRATPLRRIRILIITP